MPAAMSNRMARPSCSVTSVQYRNSGTPSSRRADSAFGIVQIRSAPGSLYVTPAPYRGGGRERLAVQGRAGSCRAGCTHWSGRGGRRVSDDTTCALDLFHTMNADKERT